MDAYQLDEAWEKICSHIKTFKEIDRSQFDAFFSRLHPQAMSGNFLMLTADNEFIKDWIEKHYSNYLNQALFDLYGEKFTVLVEVDIKEDSLLIESQQTIPQITQKPILINETSSELKEELLSEPQSLLDPLISEDSIEKRVIKNDPLKTFTFENFVIGDSNRWAYQTALMVAEEPGNIHRNPLFIYGKPGIGKTHLMRAIQNYINENYPHMKTIYVDSAQLLSDYMDAVAENNKDKESYKKFKRNYETADVLLIDDVQFLKGKDTTLDILFQIFNLLVNQGKQIVLSADKAPKNIDINERYSSRFYQGATVDIQPPEIETKLGIIKSYVREYQQEEDIDISFLSDEILIYIAENSSSNIRELKGAITKIILRTVFLNKKDLSISEVKELLENCFTGGTTKKLSVADVQKEVESFYKVSHADLIGKKRSREIVFARQVAIYLCRSLLDAGYAEIGKKFNRDHTTMIYSYENIAEKIKSSRDFEEEINTIIKMIKEA